MGRHIIQAADGTRHIIEIPDTKTSARAQAEAEDAAFQKRIKDELKESGGYLENYGAGVDSVVRGVKSLFGQGDDDAEIEENRKIKSQLAEGRVGGGLTQLAGEVLTTAPITGGIAGAAGKGLSLFPKLKTLGMAGGRTFNLGNVANAAAQGAMSGAAQETTEDESRGLNTTLGTVAGAALPGAFAGFSKLRGMLGKSQAPVRAANQFEKQLGKEGMEQVTDAAVSPTQTVLPLSTASRAQNVKLASLERGARNRSDWGYDHDKAVLERAWSELQDVTKAAGDLGARTDAKSALIKEAKGILDEIVDPAALKQAGDRVVARTERLRATPVARQNPDFNKVLGDVEAMLQHPERTAGDFASQYWRLDNLSKSGSDEVKTAIIKLRDTVKESADIASGGKFTQMLTKIQAAEKSVSTAEAAKGIRDTFAASEGKEMTSRGLRNAIAARSGEVNVATKEGGDRLVKELGQHELYQGKNAPGVSNLDIENPLNIISSGRDNPFNYFPLLKGSANWLFKGSRQATTDAADSAMQSPAAWRAMIEAQKLSQTPSVSLKTNQAFSPQDWMIQLLRQGVMLPGRAGSAEVAGE